MVRSVKDLLRKTLGYAKVTYVQLSTVLCEITATINARPLTVVTEDLEDLIPLTPAMFLHDTAYPGVSDLELLEASGFQKLFQNRKKYLQEIKMRFRREYLSLLVHRGKQKVVKKFNVGDVVFIGSDDKKRWQWPMARILELMPGKDGHVRVAKLKTAFGVFIRPVQWLFAMEVTSPKEIPKKANHERDESRNKDSVEEEEVVESQEVQEQVQTRAGRKVKVPEWYGV